MTDEQQIRTYIDTLLCLVKDGLARPILGAYKQTYSKSNYMWHIRSALKNDKYSLNGGLFKSEDILVEQLEPLSWLRLMHRRWKPLFQGKLGKTGRKYLDVLFTVRNRWAHHDFISLDDAIEAAEAAIFMLDAYRAKEVEAARDVYQALYELQRTGATDQEQDRYAEAEMVLNNGESAAPLNVVPLLKPAPPTNGLDGITIGLEPITLAGRFCLQIIEPENQPRIEYLPDGFQHIIIGRGADCAVQINDGQASRSHFMLEQGTRNSLIITDLTSRNGTYLKGKRLPDSQPVRWFVGQQIQVGRTILILRYDTEL